MDTRELFHSRVRNVADEFSTRQWLHSKKDKGTLGMSIQDAAQALQLALTNEEPMHVDQHYDNGMKKENTKSRTSSEVFYMLNQLSRNKLLVIDKAEMRLIIFI